MAITNRRMTLEDGRIAEWQEGKVEGMFE